MSKSPINLPVVETFHSLQGEGIHGGRSAFFIRLGGCRVGCHWCDTKHSWPETAHPETNVVELATATAFAQQQGAAFVVITGGEPLHHNLDELCKALEQAAPQLPRHLETSGVDAFSGCFSWITLSPKRHNPPTAELLNRCHELKVVIHEAADLTFAQSMAEAANRAGNSPALLLQPGWESSDGQRLALQFVRSQPAWRLSLQSHKWLGVR